MADQGWADPPAVPVLGSRDVHLWRSSLRCEPSLLKRLEESLSNEERERAGRFHFAEHRERFVAGRGILRSILSRYLVAAPETLQFRTAPHGKPELTVPDRSMRFNAANSGDRALYAVTREREVGVDLESIRPVADAESIAERFFSAAEWRALRAFPAAEWDSAFFTCWTRKEAFVKAIGAGLSMPLSAFDVAIAPGERARVLRAHGDPMAADRWCMYTIDVGPGWAATLVAEGRDHTLQFFDCGADN